MSETLARRVGRLVSGGFHAILDAAENLAPEAVMHDDARELARKRHSQAGRAATVLSWPSSDTLKRPQIVVDAALGARRRGKALQQRPAGSNKHRCPGCVPAFSVKGAKLFSNRAVRPKVGEQLEA